MVRGLSAAGPADLQALDAMQKELSRVGAWHLAGKVEALIAATRTQDREAAAHLLRAQTSLHLFERVLSLDTAALMLAAPGADAPPPAPPAPKAPAAPPVIEERKRLPSVLSELARAVEDLVATGLTTASEATRQKLDVSFKEASRLKLLRLGAALRYVNEELGRYLQDSASFSPRRLSFFLNRSWLLAKGMAEALREDDQTTLATLLLTGAPPILVETLEVAVLGVAKRVAQSSCSFDFRLRVLRDAPGVKAGQPLVWSCLFGAKASVPAEAFLHLPQPQKFHPKIFLENKALTVTGAAVALSPAGGRLMLGPKATVTEGKPFKEWRRFQPWDASGARARVLSHQPSPLDLPVELQEEVVLEQYRVGEAVDRGRPDQRSFPIETGSGLRLDAVVSTGAEGKALTQALEAMAKRKKPPPLFGLMHYESCRLIFQPLSTFGEDAMTQLMISDESINLKELLGSLDLHR